MKYSTLAPILAIGVAVSTAFVANAAKADPSYGLGVSFIFGGGQSDIAIGAKVFADDQPQNETLSLGLDYKINAQSFRPNVGVAYFDNDVYGDINIGYDLGAQGIDFGVGVGAWSN